MSSQPRQPGCGQESSARRDIAIALGAVVLLAVLLLSAPESRRHDAAAGNSPLSSAQASPAPGESRDAPASPVPNPRPERGR